MLPVDLSMRDYFAVAALPALIERGSACAPEAAYAIADAMLQERARKKPVREDDPIKLLNVSAGTQDALAVAGIRTMKDLARLDRTRLLNTVGGPMFLREIMRAFVDRGVPVPDAWQKKKKD